MQILKGEIYSSLSKLAGKLVNETYCSYMRITIVVFAIFTIDNTRDGENVLEIIDGRIM